MKIESTQQLREIYANPKGRAKLKVLDMLEPHSVNFIEKSPFVVISTVGQNGTLDCSPRGGKPGFVQLLDNKTLLIPDSKGNNRLDSLVNIIETGKIGCLFMIPGVDETLRINGRAWISTSECYLNRFSDEKNPPKSVIGIEVEEVFLHCAKALMRSKLWDSASIIERSSFPAMGKMINDQLGDTSKPETQEAMVKRYTDSL